MNPKNSHLDTLQDIKQIMERSSRFISLSGLSGIAAGICALIGAWCANHVIEDSTTSISSPYNDQYSSTPFIMPYSPMQGKLIQIGVITFIAAFALAFLFTFIRSKRTNVPIWGNTAQRLIINATVPMVVGGIYLLMLLIAGAYSFIAPGCLIFYGLAVLNASKYTLQETRYLGYGEMLLGIINLFCFRFDIYFWALGFGVLHIIYGVFMWWKYERSKEPISG